VPLLKKGPDESTEIQEKLIPRVRTVDILKPEDVVLLPIFCGRAG
jgi:hypothetical protein